MARPAELLADFIMSAALAQCFARPTPERAAVALTRRDLGTGGTHTTLRLLGRGPMADEALALAAQLRRLRDEGPTETEVVQALDRLGPQANGSPVSEAMRQAWHRVTGVPETPAEGWGDASVAVRSVLSRLLVVGPQMPALDELAPPGPAPSTRPS